MRILLICILLTCLFTNTAFAIKGKAAEALLYEVISDQVERERMAKAGVKKLHPEGFYKICASGSLEDVEKAIKNGANPKIPDSDRGETTCLHDAAAFNPDARVTALLVKEGVNINAQGNLNKRTALHLAILGNPNAAAIIKELAKGKPDYYLEDIDGLNPFQAAIKGPVDVKTRAHLVPDDAVLLALLEANPAYAKTDKYNPIGAYFSRFEGGVLNPNKMRPSAKVVERTIKAGCSVNTTVRGSGNEKVPLLLKAIKFDSVGKRGEDTLTRLFLEKGANVYAASENGNQAVHEAVFFGNRVALKTLLAFDTKKTLAGSKNKFGETPLHTLAQWRVEDLPAYGKMLIDAGADINARDEHGNTPFLMIAGSSGIPRRNFEKDEQYNSGVAARKKAVEFLVANGADVKAVDSKGRNPLHSLCNAQVLSKPDLEMFIKAGVDINARDTEGNTPLILFAIASSDVSAPYTYGNERSTAFAENFPIIRSAGADPKIKNKAGKVAYNFLHKDILEKAKNEVAFLQAMPAKNELTLLNVCENGCEEKVIKDALAKGMDIDPVDAKSGFTPLHMAIARNDEKTAKALIACGAPLEKAAKVGETPLGMALKGKNINIASELIRAGASINKKGYRVTFSGKESPLTTSYVSGTIFYGDMDVLSFLLQHKPDLEFKSQVWGGDSWDTDGTPLHVAIVSRKLDFAEKLLQSGANSSATLSRRSTSALHLAAEMNHKPMIELLLRYGAKMHTDTSDKMPYDYATDPEVKKLLKKSASE